MFLRTMGVDDNSLNLKRWEYLIIKRAFLPNGINNRVGEEAFLYFSISVTTRYKVHFAKENLSEYQCITLHWFQLFLIAMLT